MGDVQDQKEQENKKSLVAPSKAVLFRFNVIAHSQEQENEKANESAEAPSKADLLRSDVIVLGQEQEKQKEEVQGLMLQMFWNELKNAAYLRTVANFIEVVSDTKCVVETVLNLLSHNASAFGIPVINNTVITSKFESVLSCSPSLPACRTSSSSFLTALCKKFSIFVFGVGRLCSPLRGTSEDCNKNR